MELAEPPSEPVDNARPDSDWDAVERNIGTKLPADFKTLIQVYGSGCFGGYIYLYNPFAQGHYAGYRLFGVGNLVVLREYSEGRSNYPEFYPPYPAFPEPGGILPWGIDDNSGVLCWDTTGETDNWTIVALDSHYSDEFQSFNMSASCFLHAWLEGSIDISYFPSDVYPLRQPLFKPHTYRFPDSSTD